jgi:hypothetical protein
MSTYIGEKEEGNEGMATHLIPLFRFYSSRYEIKEI